MRVQCAWCRRELAIKSPYRDERLSHGICRSCQMKQKFALYMRPWMSRLRIGGFKTPTYTPLKSVEK